MSPKNDNQEPEAKPDVTVDIPHERHQTPPAPATAPPLPELEPLPIRPIKITDNIPSPPLVAPVVPPVSAYEFHKHEGRRWPTIIIFFVLALVVAALVVFGGSWVYKKITGSDTKLIKPAPAGQNQTPPVPPAATTQPSGSVGGPGTNQTPTPAQNSQLPNNGPGDVVALFVGTALVVGGLHFLYSLRKQN